MLKVSILNRASAVKSLIIYKRSSVVYYYLYYCKCNKPLVCHHCLPLSKRDIPSMVDQVTESLFINGNLNDGTYRNIVENATINPFITEAVKNQLV